MEQVVPWHELCALVEPHYPKAGNGRRPVGVVRMLRIYFLEQWFNLSDPAVEEALYDSPLMRSFTRSHRIRIHPLLNRGYSFSPWRRKKHLPKAIRLSLILIRTEEYVGAQLYRFRVKSDSAAASRGPHITL